MVVAHQPRGIDAKTRTVRELLAGRKYTIDYYQREYKWQTQHVVELLQDLAARFLEYYDESHELSATAVKSPKTAEWNSPKTTE